MSALAEEIVKVLSKKRKASRMSLEAAVVDKVLDDLGIPTSASKGVPVSLRIKQVRFAGTKRLRPDHPDAVGHPIEGIDKVVPQLEFDLKYLTDESSNLARDDLTVAVNDSGGDDAGVGELEEQVPRALVPFAFEWEPQEGVNGIGSGRNLRGKSTLMNVLLWSLSGRCSEFSPDSRRWINHVEVDWLVGQETLRVAFDAENGFAKNGKVTLLGINGAAGNVLATFDGDSFEAAMNSVMLGRLRLESFTVSQSGKTVLHRWPSYVSALWVRPKYLKSIIGKEPVLSIRLMQMFIGTDWVPVLATASTVAGTLAAEQDGTRERIQNVTDVFESSRAEADRKVQTLREQISALPSGSPDLAKTTAASVRAGDLAREIHSLEIELMNQSVATDTIHQQLRAAKARRHTEHEHALLTKFFHQMQPTVCPRCTALVTKERRVSEPDEHKCSVCTSDLNLEALNANVIVASSADPHVALLLMGDAGSSTTRAGDEEPGPRDEIDALEEALAAAEGAMTPLRERRNELAKAQDTASSDAALDVKLLAAAQERQWLEIELARAEGAAGAFAQPVAPSVGNTVDPIHLAVAQTAESVLKIWVKGSQDPLLAKISEDIERLTLSFGGDSLSNIRLDGAANMKLLKGGDPATYGELTPGEQLRVKIATVIALIRHGYVERLGRHPGFLMLDSPAAEEMPDEDLATMVAALIQVAEDAPMQIIVATRNTGPLEELLPEENRIIATGDSYVW